MGRTVSYGDDGLKASNYQVLRQPSQTAVGRVFTFIESVFTFIESRLPEDGISRESGLSPRPSGQYSAPPAEQLLPLDRL